MTLIAKLAAIQTKLHAPKNQKNTFGGYNYRSCEDILEAVKPLLDGLVLTITDEVTEVGGRIYVKATARLTDGTDAMTATAFAREAESRKGMDESQVTGSASSYARKYALNGLLLIDDNKDADSQDNSEQGQKAKSAPAQKPFDLPAALDWVGKGATVEQIKQRGRQAYAKATNDEERARIAALVQELEQAALASA